MKLLLIFALVAVASADISLLLNKFAQPARYSQGSFSNSFSILPALQQLKPSFSGAQQGPAQQQKTIQVIHVSAAVPQQQQYYSAPQPTYYSAPSNQYLPPVVQNEPAYQSFPVDRVTILAPSSAYQQQQQVQYVQQQAPQAHYQSIKKNKPVVIQVHVQHVAAAPTVHHVQQSQVQYAQQPAAQVYEAPSQNFQVPAETFNEVTGYSYNAPH